MNLEQQFTQLREMLALPADGDAVAIVAGLVAERDKLATQQAVISKEVETLRTKVSELEPQAKDGVQYRSDLITAALGEGVRAYGDKFAKDTYEALLRTSPISVIKQLSADWAEVGNGRFAGGRKTTDEQNEAPGSSPTGKRGKGVPDKAFSA